MALWVRLQPDFHLLRCQGYGLRRRKVVDSCDKSPGGRKIGGGWSVWRSRSRCVCWARISGSAASKVRGCWLKTRSLARGPLGEKDVRPAVLLRRSEIGPSCGDIVIDKVGDVGRCGQGGGGGRGQVLSPSSGGRQGNRDRPPQGLIDVSPQTEYKHSRDPPANCLVYETGHAWNLAKGWALFETFSY